MIGELPRLLDKNFVVGYFLPAAIFVAVSIFLLTAFDRLPAADLWQLTLDNFVEVAAVATLVVWLLALTLAILNGAIFRRKEGYAWSPLRRPLLWIQKRRLRLLGETIDELEAEAAACRADGTRPPPELDDDLRHLRNFRATHFPHQESLLLPRSFGNTVRAFEVYSLVMYGFEATRGWARLLLVMPREARLLVESAKAQLDFLMNIWFLSWIVLVQYAALAALERELPVPWLPVLAALSLGLSSRWCAHAANHWGEMIRSSVDLYLPQLARTLGFRQPRDRVDERRMWESFSRAFLNRDPDSLPPLPRAARPRRRRRA